MEIQKIVFVIVLLLCKIGLSVSYIHVIARRPEEVARSAAFQAAQAATEAQAAAAQASRAANQAADAAQRAANAAALAESVTGAGNADQENISILRKIRYVESIPSLLSFWRFQEPPSTPRLSTGRYPYPLQEDTEFGDSIPRSPEGIFGRYSASLHPGQRFRIKRGQFPNLDIHGHNNVSIVAWIKRKPWCNFSNYTAWDPVNPCCEFVAGVFNESSKHRQYGLFLNLHSFNSSDQVCALISDNGGDTPGYTGCVSGSFGRTKIKYFEWQCIGMTYDNDVVKSYVNGYLDYRRQLNPFHYPNGIFNGGPRGADFTVGGNSAFGKKHNYLYGQFGGLAVFGRALKGEEMQQICRRTRRIYKARDV